MPRYHFHVDGGSTPDAEGTELDDLATAKCEAVKLAGALICGAADTFWDTQDFSMTVTDEDRLTLFTLDLIATESAAVGAHP